MNKQIVIGIAVAIITLISDQFSKWLIFEHILKEVDTIQITPFLNLVKVYNFGISFGMFASFTHSQIVFSLIALIITIILLYWLKKSDNMLLSCALGMVIGGAMGNVVDRIFIGAVADFIDIHILGYHWPAFNVADSAICVGVFILLLESVITPGKKIKGEAREQ